VTILGATGSIGQSTLDLIARDSGAYEIEALTARNNASALAALALKFKPKMVAVADPSAYRRLSEALAGSGIEVAVGEEALLEAASRPADWVMAAIVGAAGLATTLAAVRRGVIVAIANKESLVCAGDLLLAEARASGATLLPVDSEHNAIYQVFDAARPERIERIFLTASGGPFRTSSLDDMRVATPEQALAHPVWRMGAKISVDSATLMNKGLEMIEASRLFPLRADQIEVLIHPQSVIHSLVAYVDGSVLAQLGSPDMRTPIAYTLAWPDRMPAPSPRLDLAALGQLTFEAPDPVRFPALKLAAQALAAGGAAPTILNAANEVAVAAFLDRRIGFLHIAQIVADVLDRVGNRELASLEAVWEADHVARTAALALTGQTPRAAAMARKG
jgi:1-deoxy-D-xylulose-5-phosphate reductoisomerase